ncbi:MAG: hypothetical protein ABSF60_09085 [Verrucomicrobiota bacterium]
MTILFPKDLIAANPVVSATENKRQNHPSRGVDVEEAAVARRGGTKRGIAAQAAGVSEQGIIGHSKAAGVGDVERAVQGQIAMHHGEVAAAAQLILQHRPAKGDKQISIH